MADNYNLTIREIIGEIQRKIDKRNAKIDYLKKSIKGVDENNKHVLVLKNEIYSEQQAVIELQGIIDYIKNHKLANNG